MINLPIWVWECHVSPSHQCLVLYSFLGLNTRNLNGPGIELFGLLSKMLLKHFTDLSCPSQCKTLKSISRFCKARLLFLPNLQKTRSYPPRQVRSLAWDASLSEIKSEVPYWVSPASPLVLWPRGPGARLIATTDIQGFLACSPQEKKKGLDSYQVALTSWHRACHAILIPHSWIENIGRDS